MSHFRQLVLSQSSVAALIAIAMPILVGGCGASGDSSGSTQVTLPSVTAPSAKTTSTAVVGEATMPAAVPGGGKTAATKVGAQNVTPQTDADRAAAGSDKKGSTAAEQGRRDANDVGSATAGSADKQAASDKQRVGG
jgi:hypothetical protein